MQDFQKRVVDERNELDEKITKLEAFLPTQTFRGLSVDEQERMKSQLEYMTGYRNVLDARINAFGG